MGPVLLALLCAAVAPAPPDPDGPGFVEVLERAGLYREARAELSRQEQLRGDASAFEPAALFELGIELARAGDLPQAIQTIEEGAALEKRDRIADEWHLTLGTLRLKLGDYPVAEGYFSRVFAFSDDPSLRLRAERLACVGHLWALDPTPARSCTLALLGRSPPVEQRLSSVESEGSWRGYVGGILSAIVPGLGQATAGEPLDGLIALGVNGGAAAGAVAMALSGDLLDAVVLVAGVAARYYVGNIEHGSADWDAVASRRRRRDADALIREIAALSL